MEYVRSFSPLIGSGRAFLPDEGHRGRSHAAQHVPAGVRPEQDVDRGLRLSCPSRPTFSNSSSRQGAPPCFGSFSRATGSRRARKPDRAARRRCSRRQRGWQAGVYVFGDSDPMALALERIARHRDTAPRLSREEPGKRDREPRLVGAGHRLHEPGIAVRRGAVGRPRTRQHDRPASAVPGLLRRRPRHPASGRRSSGRPTREDRSPQPAPLPAPPASGCIARARPARAGVEVRTPFQASLRTPPPGP